MSAAPTPGLAPGRLVVFAREGDAVGNIALGLVAGREGKRAYLATDAEGRVSSLSPRDVKYLVPPDATGAAFTQRTVAEFEAALRSAAAAAERRLELQSGGDAGYAGEGSAAEEFSSIHAAWQTLVGQDRPGYDGVSPEEVAQMAFGDASPLSCYLAFGLLEGQQGRLLFTAAKGGKYRPRSSAMVLEAQRKELAARQEKEAMEKVLGLVQETLKANRNAALPQPPHMETEGLPSPQQDILRSLMDLGARCHDRPSDPPGPPQPLATELLKRLGRLATSPNAFKLCVQLGLFGTHENLFLRNSGFLRPFSPEALAEAELITANIPPDLDTALRKDLRHLKAYAVDSADTLEVDDAISLEVLEDGRDRIWIHIADPTRWIEEDGALYRDAMARQTSLYLPDFLVTMLPLPLAQHVLSLRTGGDSCALSVAIELAEDGSIASAEVTPSLVRVTYRLPYEELDNMLYEGVGDNEEEALGRLSRLADLRLQYRGSRGSVDRFSPRPPSFIAKARKEAKAEGGFAVDVWPDDPNGRGKQLVTEMMVLAGEAVARVATLAGLGVPYRRQAPPASAPADSFLMQFPERYCRSQAVCRFMMAAEVSAEPGPHSGLGLEGYVQWSSPIRRFNDLLVHYQLKKHIRRLAAAGGGGGGSGGSSTAAAAAEGGQALLPLAPTEIMQRAKAGEAAMGLASRVSRNSARYWLIELLRRGMASKKEYEAYVMGMQDKREKGGKVVFSLLLTELGATLSLSEPNAAALRLGETVLVRATVASPRGMVVTLQWRPRDSQVGSGPKAIT